MVKSITHRDDSIHVIVRKERIGKEMAYEEKLLLGTVAAKQRTQDLAQQVEQLQKRGKIPTLTIMRVGERADDIAYEQSALKRMAKIGVACEVQGFPNNVEEEDFLTALRNNNENSCIHGILIFLPLPNHLDSKRIKNSIHPKKDIDCISPINAARLMNAEKGFVPCTPKAVIEMLKYYNIEMQGKNIVVIGRSMVVGKPLSLLLLNENATVTVTHSKTRNLSEITRQADIIICALGKARFLTGEYVTENSIVIDVGINVDENGALCGDADTQKLLPLVKAITPVPRGVGSMTTVMLAQQVIQACMEDE